MVILAISLTLTACSNKKVGSVTTTLDSPTGISKVTGDIEATGDIKADDSLVVTNSLIHGDLEQKISSGSFADATTTIVAVANPFSASSTVDLVKLINSGVATSTYTITCGDSLTAYANSVFNVLTSDSISTSTSFGTVTNNVSSSYGNGIGGGSVARITVGPSQYLVCKVSTVYTGAFTETTNTFAGTYLIRWTR